MSAEPTPSPLPSAILHAISSDGGGRIVLVLGAGCSVEEPTDLPLSGDLSEDCHRRLCADGSPGRQRGQQPPRPIRRCRCRISKDLQSERPCRPVSDGRLLRRTSQRRIQNHGGSAPGGSIDRRHDPEFRPCGSDTRCRNWVPGPEVSIVRGPEFHQPTEAPEPHLPAPRRQQHTQIS